MKKGFTLIELLAVIVVLAVIALIAVPRIMDAIDESRAGALRQNNEAVIKAAQNYFVENASDLPQEIGDSFEVPLQTLINNDLINDISSPYSSNNCIGYVLATKTESGHEFIPHINCNENINSSIDDGLLSHFVLSGNRLDYSLNNTELTNNYLIPSEDRFGNENGALYLGEENHFSFTIPNSNENQLTISAWFNIDGIAPRHNCIASINGFRFYVSRDNHITSNYWLVGSETVGNTSDLPIEVKHNGWDHVVVTYDGYVKQLYLNGKLLDEFTVYDEGTIRNNTVGYIGQYSNSNPHYFHGSIGDVRYYQRALSSNEVKQLYNQTR